MYWLEVSVVTDGEAAEAVAEALQPLAYSGSVVLEQLGDMDNLDPDAMETAVTVKIYLSADDDTADKRRRIQEILYHMNRLYPIAEPTFKRLEEQDWANAWKEHYKPFRLGQRVWIQPTWVEADHTAIQPDDIVLTLDPGMAFGTGLHPTTQMCLQALEAMVQPNMSVVDIGTGSGILAILAAKLGASPIFGVDTDMLAVEAATQNAQQNEVANIITIEQGSLEDVQKGNWDLVVVNILAPIIIAMIQEHGLLDVAGENGRYIFSGIIDQQLPEMTATIEEFGGQIEKTYQIRDWVALVVTVNR